MTIYQWVWALCSQQLSSLVNIFWFNWIYLSDTPQIVAYASKEAAESSPYDYLSVHRRDLLAWASFILGKEIGIPISNQASFEP